MALFTHAWLTGWRALHGAALAAAFGGALLAKGPVGLALPLAGMLTAWWLGRPPDRPREPLAGRHLAAVAGAALAGVGLFLLWAWPADRATGGELARLGLGQQVVARSLRPLEGHGGPYLLGLAFHPLAALVTFFPWTLYLPAALSAVAGGRVGGRSGRALLAGWVLPTFAVMTLVATKLPHYVLPAWPGLALGVAGTIEAAERGELSPRDRRWLARGAWLFGPVGLALGAGLAAAPWWLGLPSLRAPLGVLGLAFAALTVLGLALHRRARPRRTAAALLAGWVGLAAILGGWVLPALGRLEVSRPLARAIRRATPPGVPVATLGYGEPSLVFYLGRWPVEELSGEAQAAAWARRSGPGVLVLPRRELAALRRRPGLPALAPVAAASGLDLVTGRRLDLVAVRRSD